MLEVSKREAEFCFERTQSKDNLTLRKNYTNETSSGGEDKKPK